MVWYLVLKKVQNFSWNAVRSTRSIGVKGWYFINFFFICRSYFERITDFQWQEIPENLFEIYLKLISNLFENLIFKGTISATEVKNVSNWDQIINVFFIFGLLHHRCYSTFKLYLVIFDLFIPGPWSNT